MIDKERDSNSSEIQLVLGDHTSPRLWQNGKENPISPEEAQRYERWVIWRASHLEKRIIEELFANQ